MTRDTEPTTSEGGKPIELTVWGDVEDTQTDDEPPMAIPQTVTVPRPGKGDHLAVVHTSYEVTWLAVLVDEQPGTCESTLGMDVVFEEDCGITYGREFWISADALEQADTLHVSTRGPDLGTIELDVTYRGRLWRLMKPVHDTIHTHKERKAIDD